MNNKEENFEDDNIFSDGFWINCGSDEDDLIFPEEDMLPHEWKPRYPVDMDHPAELTTEQQEHARVLIEAIDKYMDEHPDDAGQPPLLRITQNWEVVITRGGFMNDTDFVDPILCVMCHDEEGYYVDYKYVMQCVPFIEKELQKMAEYGDSEIPVPSCRQQEVQRATELEMNMIDILTNLDPAYGYENVLIAVDRVIPEVYAIPATAYHEDYGGLIQYYRADTLISPDGTMDIDQIKKIAKESLEEW